MRQVEPRLSDDGCVRDASLGRRHKARSYRNVRACARDAELVDAFELAWRMGEMSGRPGVCAIGELGYGGEGTGGASSLQQSRETSGPVVGETTGRGAPGGRESHPDRPRSFVRG